MFYFSVHDNKYIGHPVTKDPKEDKEMQKVSLLTALKFDGVSLLKM